MRPSPGLPVWACFSIAEQGLFLIVAVTVSSTVSGLASTVAVGSTVAIGSNACGDPLEGDGDNDAWAMARPGTRLSSRTVYGRNIAS